MNYFSFQEFLYAPNVIDYISTLTLYMSIKILILVGGQRFHNEADILNQNLAKLHNLLITRPECARSARALSRRLHAAPLRVRLQRALPVRAELLTDMFAVVLNYTIILLQFNHVI
ncbi:uncharacterized protein LOC133521663 [Cydia pomonella]|uniref:uncharacterized protein LOC133521663 n=1 Tax=Cydia pomonella TaxID=82600 RepID=UPI002ADDF3C2|nr:uncharacterized protein LOC133521663 [Cydia pomonella]